MKKLNYNFKNPQLLELALTQSGANAEHNNERLEFVGDRVLGLSVAALLYEMFPNEHEGELARRHAVLEAVFGAIFFDGGFEMAQKIIVSIWRDLAAADVTAPKDAKTALQELVQKMDNGALPEYEYLAQTGASHKPTFNVRVTAMGQSADGCGASKKAASIAAADKKKKKLAI